MIDMQGIVLADNVQQAERNLQELDSVDWLRLNWNLWSLPMLLWIGKGI